MTSFQLFGVLRPDLQGQINHVKFRYSDPSIPIHSSQLRSGPRVSLNRDAQISPSPATSSNSWRSQASQETWSLQRVLGLPRGLQLVGRAPSPSPGRRLGGLLTRCPNHLIWLFSARRTSSSTLYSTSPKMTDLLILSLREPSHPTEEAHFSRLYTRSRSFGQSSWPYVRVGTKIDRWIESLAFWLSSVFTTMDRHRARITAVAACRSPTPFSPRPRGTWTPPLGVGSPPQPEEGPPPFSRLRTMASDLEVLVFHAGRCEPIQRELEVTDRWGQQENIICKKQRPDPEVAKPDPLNTPATPTSSVHEGYEQNQW